MSEYVQGTCQSCRQAVWVHPAGPVPCPHCGTHNLAQPAGGYVPPVAQGPMGQGGYPQTPGQGGYAQAPAQGGYPGVGAAMPAAHNPMGPPMAHNPMGPPMAGAPVPGAPVSAGAPMPGAPAAGSPAIGTMGQSSNAGSAKISAGGMSFNMPTYGGGMNMTKGKVALGIVGSIVLAAGSVGFYWFKNKNKARKGNISYSRLHIDSKAADPDDMISSLSGHARKWRRDAGFWAINVHGVRKDGTVNFSDGGSAVVTYISPRGVQAASKRGRRDSIKKYSFGTRDVNHKRKYQASNRWKNVVLPPAPACGIKQLVQTLNLADGQKVRVSFDPQFAYGPGMPREISWHVFSDDERVAGYYSMATCALTKKPPPKAR